MSSLRVYFDLNKNFDYSVVKFSNNDTVIVFK